MTPREIEQLRRRIRRRPAPKPKIPEMAPPPEPAAVRTIWVAPRRQRAWLVRQAVVVFTPIAAGAAALAGAAWAGLL